MWIFKAFCMIILLKISNSEDIRDLNSKACSSVEIVSREKWRARPTLRDRWMPTPVNKIIIEHTVTPYCKTKMNCIRNVQFVQDIHMDEMGFWDIGYNFVIGGDGRAYYGRGWNHPGAHSVNFNSNSLGIAFLGNFNIDYPSESMINATLNLIDCGVSLGYLTPIREIYGHKDVACTESPGKHLYKIIRNWPNYKGGRMPGYNCG